MNRELWDRGGGEKGRAAQKQMERGEVSEAEKAWEIRSGVEKKRCKDTYIYTDKEKRGWGERKRYIYIYRKRWGEW